MELKTYIQNWKDLQAISLNELASKSGIDQGLLSKYLNGKRIPSDRDLARLATAMEVDYSQLRQLYLADKIVKLLEYENAPLEILAVAETRVEYLTSKDSFKLPKLSKKIQQQLDQIDELQQIWASKKPLQGVQLEKMEEYFRVKYTYESNRIEGNTLTYQETHLVVNEGLTIGGKSMADHLEAVNHNEAVEWLVAMVRENESINKRNLLGLHQLILKSIDSAHAGVYRNVQVRIGGSAHVPPDPLLVDQLMEDYFAHYNKQKKILHPVILAAEMHERLASIHPFVDGNGRTARLVMNFILLKYGYTLANLKGDDTSRMNYYRALEKVQVENDPESFYHLVCDAVLGSLKEHLEMV